MSRKNGIETIVEITALAVIAILLFSSVAAAVNYNDPIGTYKGVTAYSNGPCVAKYSGIYEGTDCSLSTNWVWQCVEYVKRFYRDAMSIDTSSWGGNGHTYYDKAVSGILSPYLTPYANGGSMPPKPDDLLGLSGGDGGYGHVAIITEVGDNYVRIIEQNWARNDAIHEIPYDRAANRIGDANGDRGKYHIQGWLRKDAWHFNTPNNPEGWTASGIESGDGKQSVENGAYFINPERNDPYIYSASLSLDANYYDSLEINMASNAPNGVGQIYFATSSSPTYSDDKRVEFYVTNNGNWYTYTIYMANHNQWQGTITGIRIDPAAMGKEGTGKNEFDINPLMLYYKIIKAE